MSYHAWSNRHIGVRRYRGRGYPENSAPWVGLGVRISLWPAEIPGASDAGSVRPPVVLPMEQIRRKTPEPIRASAHQSLKEHHHQRDAEGFRLLPDHQGGAGP